MKWVTVLKRRSSNGKTTRYVSFLNLLSVPTNLKRLRWSASTLGNFLIRILQFNSMSNQTYVVKNNLKYMLKMKRTFSRPLACSSTSRSSTCTRRTASPCWRTPASSGLSTCSARRPPTSRESSPLSNSTRKTWWCSSWVFLTIVFCCFCSCSCYLPFRSWDTWSHWQGCPEIAHESTWSPRRHSVSMLRHSSPRLHSHSWSHHSFESCCCRWRRSLN